MIKYTTIPILDPLGVDETVEYFGFCNTDKSEFILFRGVAAFRTKKDFELVAKDYPGYSFYLSLLPEARGTGITTQQMINAPNNAYYVWSTNNLTYPRSLAQTLCRTDLVIVSKDEEDLKTLTALLAQAEGGK